MIKMVRATPWLMATALLCLLCFAPNARADDGAASARQGKSYDYDYDGRDIGHAERAWRGRAYVAPKAAAASKPLPLVVFLHGLNKALIKHRWMGGGNEGDVRYIVGAMVERGAIEPVIVAGPGSVVASQVSRGASWNHFDLDHFIDRTVAELKGKARVDPQRIIVAGHSGAGCSSAGGLATLGKSKRKLLGIMSIDTCMGGDLAKRLARSDPNTHVVVSYQSVSWSKRPFKLFRRIFERQSAEHPANSGVLRELDHQRPKRAPHDATVKLSFEGWLPKILARR
jgi:hypothetical protein